MVTSKRILEIIEEIIEKKYNQLTISVLGRSVFSEKELEALKDQGIDLDSHGNNSFLRMAYLHNFINKTGDLEAPTSLEDLKSQLSNPQTIPVGEAHNYSIEHLNENAHKAIEKLRQDMIARFTGLARDNNNDYKMNALQNLDRSDEADKLVKESTIGRLKQSLRDLSKQANRDWERIVNTEVSNAVGLGSSDRIVSENKDKPLEEVYVYKIPVNDAKLCKHCRRFFLDSDGSPKVYKLSQLLSNGTNYGKKAADWSPVSGAVHPNCRESQVLELKPGWKVEPGGSVKFIGREA